MEYRRTAVIKLDTPEEADPLLRETVEQFKHCANTASEWCWHGDDGYLTITLPRTSVYSISVVGKMQTMEAHP